MTFCKSPSGQELRRIVVPSCRLDDPAPGDSGASWDSQILSTPTTVKEVSRICDVRQEMLPTLGAACSPRQMGTTPWSRFEPLETRRTILKIARRFPLCWEVVTVRTRLFSLFLCGCLGSVYSESTCWSVEPTSSATSSQTALDESPAGDRKPPTLGRRLFNGIVRQVVKEPATLDGTAATQAVEVDAVEAIDTAAALEAVLSVRPEVVESVAHSPKQEPKGDWK